MNRLSNLDITQSQLPFGTVDCVYSDPPWGQGNLKYWRTMNKQPDFKVDWLGFVRKFFEHCQRHCPNGKWYIETGVRFVDDVMSQAPRNGISLECVYRAGGKWLPNVLLVFGGEFPNDVPVESDRYGINLVKWALAPLPVGSKVLDPCCGLGTTAKACRQLGLEFYGNELNPARLERTRKVLE
jgi:predicted RNA methylase